MAHRHRGGRRNESSKKQRRDAESERRPQFALTTDPTSYQRRRTTNRRSSHSPERRPQSSRPGSPSSTTTRKQSRLTRREDSTLPTTSGGATSAAVPSAAVSCSKTLSTLRPPPDRLPTIPSSKRESIGSLIRTKQNPSGASIVNKNQQVKSADRKTVSVEKNPAAIGDVIARADAAATLKSESSLDHIYDNVDKIRSDHPNNKSPFKSRPMPMKKTPWFAHHKKNDLAAAKAKKTKISFSIAPVSRMDTSTATVTSTVMDDRRSAAISNRPSPPRTKSSGGGSRKSLLKRPGILALIIGSLVLVVLILLVVLIVVVSGSGASAAQINTVITLDRVTDEASIFYGFNSDESTCAAARLREFDDDGNAKM